MLLFIVLDGSAAERFQSCLIRDEPVGGIRHAGVIVKVEAAERLSLEQIRAFLEASNELGFQGRGRAEVYGWVNQVLCQQRCQFANRNERGWCGAIWRK